MFSNFVNHEIYFTVDIYGNIIYNIIGFYFKRRVLVPVCRSRACFFKITILSAFVIMNKSAASLEIEFLPFSGERFDAGAETVKRFAADLFELCKFLSTWLYRVDIFGNIIYNIIGFYFERWGLVPVCRGRTCFFGTRACSLRCTIDGKSTTGASTFYSRRSALTGGYFYLFENRNKFVSQLLQNLKKKSKFLKYERADFITIS